MATSTTDIINEIIDKAIKTADDATQAATIAAQVLLVSRAGLYVPPPSSSAGFSVSAVEPEIPTVGDSLLTFEAQLERIVALLSGQLASFFSTYYPLAADAFDEATNWLINTITNGGTGINVDVETAIWQRARERVIVDGRRVQAKISTGFSAKGYTLAPGAMLKKMEEALYDQAGKTGEASTTIASKQIDVEIDTIKFAIGQAITSRSMAMQAAAEYIKAVASAPASAVNIANLNTDAQAKMMAAASSWYGARLDRDKIILSSKLAEMSSTDDIYKHKRDNAVRGNQVDIQGLAASADVSAKVAQAALLSLNSDVSATVNSFS